MAVVLYYVTMLSWFSLKLIKEWSKMRRRTIKQVMRNITRKCGWRKRVRKNNEVALKLCSWIIHCLLWWWRESKLWRESGERGEMKLLQKQDAWARSEIWFCFLVFSLVERVVMKQSLLLFISNLTPGDSPQTYNLTNTVELSLSWEAASCSAAQKFPNILRNPKVYHHIHKSPLPVPSWARWIQPYISMNHFSIILPPVSRSS
jgi:hypothetical protein